MLQLKLNNIQISLQQSRFPDTASGIHLSGAIPVRVETAAITAKFNEGSSLNDLLFEIALLVDIIRNINNRAVITLFLPYIPYARQDRRVVRNDSFSLQVFTSLLNMLELDSVLVFDAHSDVAPALINNVVHLRQHEIISINPVAYDLGVADYVLVAPDAGSLKKIHKVGEVLKSKTLAILDKVRNVATGEISGTKLLTPISDVADRKCLIVDDICDGGATFIAAAAELRNAGAESVSLWVTHGIFSRGVDHLLNNGVDHIYTTDSYYGAASSSNVTVYQTSGIAAMRFRHA